MATAKQTVLITGTSSGIGHSLARILHATGKWHVLATARRPEQQIADLAQLGITILPLDVDDPASIKALLSAVEEIVGGKHGKGLDMLINNAGRNLTVPALDLDFDDVESLFRTNLYGPMRMCQAFAPLLIQARGHIVQIGSVAAIMPFVFGSAYNASKAALHQYSNTLRLELEPLGVRVTTVVTGGVKSQIARTDRELVPGSVYKPLEAEYLRRVKYSQEVGTETDTYGRAVVKEILKRPNPPRLTWQGAGAWLVWFASTFLPAGVMDFYFRRLFNLNKLKQSRNRA